MSSNSTNPQLKAASATPALLRDMNERKIMDALRRQGAMTRAALVRETGLSHPTVSKIVESLCDVSILEEGELEQPDMGRPARVVALASLKSQVIGVVIGVHRCSMVATGLDGVVRKGSHIEFDTPDSYDGLLAKFTEKSQEFVSSSEVKTLGMGICVPGLLDTDKNALLVCPNLSYLEGRSLVEDLECHLKFPVVLSKAMAAHYLYEVSYGAAQDLDDFVVLNYAGGLGITACCDGRMIKGRGGLAGELGHITVDIDGELCGCGNRGCLETVASDQAVLREVSKLMGRPLDMDEVFELSRSGVEEVGEVLERSARYFSVGLAAAINVFNPQAIFVYGKFLKAEEGLFKKVIDWTAGRALDQCVGQCEIIQPEKDPHICQQIGAAAAIIEKLTDSAASNRRKTSQYNAA